MEAYPKKHWFKFEAFLQFPKPICWQGWACYAITILAIIIIGRFLIMIGKGSTPHIVLIIVTCMTCFMAVAITKSNFIEKALSLKQM
ncbi:MULTISPECIES: hypothetical protein [Methanobacterium]|jgi:hypothetical protein|uniref:Uncharacterized protein n=1 Tax=Methanobacterium veterum TaxID=408577 RepID=A0A9E5A640_9EURY|nr:MULTISPECIES: hypothetical protein [Methanobacterium]MCZ3364534.1 hypothetical protein [Methanobacterium veterum]MCZ3372288.1 hypothetical protein [Methanobacterium veterum]